MAPITEQQFLEMKRRVDKFTGKVDPSQFQYSSGEAEPVPKKKRIRQSSKPLMNGLEQEFFRQIKDAGTLYTQAIRFRLGNGIWYKPDFILFGAPGSKPKAIEVKGPHAFRGGFENLKVAAGLYKEFRFFLAWKENGNWCEQEVLA